MNLKTYFFLLFSLISIYSFGKKNIKLSDLANNGTCFIKPNNNSLLVIENNTCTKQTIFLRVGTQNISKYHSVDIFRNVCGFNYEIFLNIDNKIFLNNGPLVPLNIRKSHPDLQTFKIIFKKGQKLNINLKINNENLKETDNSIIIYNSEAFFDLKNKEKNYLSTSNTISLLFLGSLIIMIFFSFLIFLQNKAKDFLSYAGYLLFVLIFSIIADFPIKYASFFVWDFPKVFIQSKEVFVFSYLVCYHLFFIEFLKLKTRLKSVYKSLKLIYIFFIGLIVTNILILLFANLQFQNIAFRLNSIVLYAVIPYYGYVIFKLFKIRHYNFYRYILWGVLFFYAGNLGGTLSQIYEWSILGLLPNNYTQIGTFLELCFFSLGLGSKMIYESKKKEKYQKQTLELQMMALQSQMNPHFTFNSINAIRNLIIQNHNTKASEYLIKFSKLLRLTLENSVKTNTSLRDSIYYLKLYVDMEGLRFDKTLTFKIIEDVKSNSELIFLPPMLLQPFVENAIKHAFNLQSVNKTIVVSIIQSFKTLIIKIEDNGIGINKSLSVIDSNHVSRATSITKNYISKWNRLLPNLIDLKIEDKKDIDLNETGTLVTIKLRLS